MKMFRAGVDIGGTFTDVVLADEGGGIVRAKALTTPNDYTEGVIAALERAAERLQLSLPALMKQCTGVVNGTTVVTNAIAQQKGRRVGLLTTRGFKQQIYIHRGIRDIQMDLQKAKRPPDIVRQRHVVEIDERVTRDGEVLVALDEDGVKRGVQWLVEEEGIDALAVCYLWSFRHPDHEHRTAEIVGELHPDLFCTLSSEIYPRIREYERMNTAVLNAFVSEGAEVYVARLGERLTELGLAADRVSFMQSLGGRIGEATAVAEPIRLSHSGPVGGVVAAGHFASALGEADVITADVGGTSFDTALIKRGRPAYAHRTTINRLLTGLSAIDINAIGAGGGSIAWVDDRGLAQLGPHSAGGYPGPACYGNGGTEPTITDANLVLGLIDPEHFWGGSLTLDVDAAKRALEPVAEQIGLTLVETAAGLHEIAVTNMATATATVTLGRGYDPRDFVMLGYGGGAGLFLAEVCQELGIRRLVIPRAAGTFSAYGLLFADSVHASATTASWLVPMGDLTEINELYAELEANAVDALEREGFAKDEIELSREADAKFLGQSFDIPISLPGRALTEADRESLQANFLGEYTRVYGPGAAWEGFPVRLETARVVATGQRAKPPLVAAATDSRSPQARDRREIHIGNNVVMADAFDGPSLEPGALIAGPALIDDVDTTVFVPDGVQLDVDGLHNYVLSLEAGTVRSGAAYTSAKLDTSAETVITR
jgi:N-methylhydantoinase A